MRAHASRGVDAPSTPGIAIRLLGRTRVELNDTNIPPGTMRQRALLALLALNARHTVSLEAIVDGLWADVAPDRAEVSVRSYVSNLRRLLEPERRPRDTPRLLVTDGTGYRLEVDDDAVDALRFATLAAAAARAERSGDVATALATAVRALDCWDGPALVDVQDAPFALGVAARLAAERDRVSMVHLRSLVDLGRHDEALGPLDSKHAADPIDETAAGLLMRVLYSLGRPTDALERYGRLRGALAERGLLPSPALRDLESAILQHRLPVHAPHVNAGTTEALPRPPELVGRDEPWRRLASAVSGDARFASWVILLGEAGIGKTYLVERLAAGFRGPVFWGRAHRDRDQPPLSLWRTMIDDLTVGSGTGLSALATDLREGLDSAAASGRVLVVLDDVQWADADSLRILRLLAMETSRVPVTFVIAARSAVAPDVQTAMTDVKRQTDVTVIDLEPFGPDDVDALTAQIGIVLDAPEADELLATSNGNPLLLRELLRLPPERRRGPLPRDVIELVAARLERLPPETSDLLVSAAIAGDGVDVELLARSHDLDPREVIDLLDPAFAAAILDSRTLRFRHITTRDAVLLDVSPATLRERHLTIADTMAADPGRWPASQLVHHRAAARPLGDIDDLIHAVRRASEDARAVGAHSDQVRVLEIALAEDAVDVTTRLELTIDAAEASGRAGDDLDAQRHAAAALDLSESIADRASAARTVTVLGRGGGAWYWVPFGQHPEELLARIERAALHAEDADRSVILATLAVGESYGPDPTRPGRLADRALDLARRTGDPIARSEALVAASWTGFGLASPADLLALVDELDDLDGVLSPDRQMAREGFRLAATLRSGDLIAAASALGRGETLARIHRRPAFEATFAWARSTILAATGELRAARDAAHRAHLLHQRTQVYGAELARHLVTIHHLDQAGDLASARADADALATMDDHGDLYQLRVAAAHHDTIDVVAVEARIAAVLAEPAAWHRTSRLAVIGMLAADLGLREVGCEVANALEPFATELIAPGTALVCAGPAALTLARLDALDGRPSDATDRLRAALDAARDAGLHGWEAPLLVELADLVRGAGDGEGARAAAQRAVKLARRIGQPGVATRAAQLLD